jgi:hypothetical protein
VDDREQVRRAEPRIGGHGMAFTVFPMTRKESPANPKSRPQKSKVKTMLIAFDSEGIIHKELFLWVKP